MYQVYHSMQISGAAPVAFVHVLLHVLTRILDQKVHISVPSLAKQCRHKRSRQPSRNLSAMLLLLVDAAIALARDLLLCLVIIPANRSLETSRKPHFSGRLPGIGCNLRCSVMRKLPSSDVVECGTVENRGLDQTMSYEHSSKNMNQT